MQYGIYVLFLLPLLAIALVEEDVMPEMLKNCYESKLPSSKKESEIKSTCLEEYLSHLFGNTTHTLLDKQALAWFESLGQNIHMRIKRNTHFGYGYGYGIDRRIVRKEIRTLTNRQRNEFFAAVNELKNDDFIKPNKYDIFALLHQGAALPSAHRGPGFLPWHRYYLYLFEEALRTKKKNVALPYWDSSLDHVMDKPEETVLFTEIFLGNGQGVVYTGPFANWRTPAQNTYLRRDIPGPRSSLIDPEKIKNVFAQRYHKDILFPTSKDDLNNLEAHHDGVHRWVGGRDGHMGGLDTSPQDPVFWLHHCYIDYLWEKFRQKQMRRGIRPEIDYPDVSDDLPHQFDREMDNLKPPKTNRWGFSNYFTRDVYRYDPAPSCKNRCGRSFFLFCNRKINRCQSRSRKQFVTIGGFSKVESPYIVQSRPTINRISPSVNVEVGQARDTGAAQQPNFAAALDTQMTNVNAAPRMAAQFAASIVDTRTTARKKRSTSFYQDENGDDPLKWAAMPISIVNEHTSGYSVINDTQGENGAISNLFEINVQTVGFSYNARHTDNIYIDKRTQFSQSRFLAVFKKPVFSQTKAYITVKDSLGGVCVPQCLVLDANQQYYKECTGVLKITPDLPLMYIDNDSYIDDNSIGQTFLRFICNNK